MNAFAARLRADRENAGLTVRQLADRSRISFSYITKIENARSGKGISPEIVSTLAKAVGCDELEYLYLADIVPWPLKELLADQRSRSFIRALLGATSKHVGWDRLEAVLVESEAKYSVSNNKPRQESVT